MCGFIGVASPYSQDNRDWLNNGSKKLSHRGPDDSGIWWKSDYSVGLAHRRLSILDLTESSSQPMRDINRDLSLVFNGEIYNYREIKAELIKKGYEFNSNGDTEIILKAYIEWGINMTNKLNGMFSFGLYDAKIDKFYLARDRAGEKPLFFYHDDKALYFSSELTALFENKLLPRNIDFFGLNTYLTMGHSPTDSSLVKGFKKLKPSHILEYSCKDNNFKIYKYWEIPKFNVYNYDENYYFEKLENLLEDSVKLQMNSDVPMGFLLSGGLDSSLIASIGARTNSKLKTFCISYPEFKGINEYENSNLIANHIGSEHNKVELSSNDFDSLFEISYKFDEPISDSSIFPTWLICKNIKASCKVAIAGDGADELFGGYYHYQRIKYALSLRKIIPQRFFNFVNNINLKNLPIGFRGRDFIRLLSNDFEEKIPITSRFFDKFTLKKLSSSLINNEKDIKNYLLKLQSKDYDMIQRATRFDFKNYLTNDILVKIDRASMLNSIEMRSPYLDYRIINFAFGEIPSNLKLRRNKKKYILQKLAQKILPNNFDTNRKQGFLCPINQIVRKSKNLNFIKEILLCENSIFNKNYIKNIILENQNGLNNGEYINLLFQFELWRKINNINY